MKEKRFLAMRQKSVITALAICAVALIAGVSPAFAGEYETGIDAFSYGPYDIPAYDGDPSEIVNGNDPQFGEAELTKEPAIYFGELDSLGRCTPSFGELNQSLMPTGKRGSISSVYPTGWVQEKYDIVPGKYLFNRAHIIGWQLCGADLNTMTKAELSKDLITGTRYLNVGNGSTGMVGYENEVAAYLKKDAGNYVSYRVSPIFFDNDLVARGVLMEAQSVGTDDIEFCAFCYNVQPEIAIDYETGKSKLAAAVEENISLSECTLKTGTKAVYTGKKLTIPVTITHDGKTLSEGTDYKTVYTSNILPGRATVQIAGVGKYKGAVTAHFVIVPARASIKSLQTKKGQIRIAVKAQKSVSGYQYSWRLKGKKWQTAEYQGKVRVIKKLKSKKTYQVRIRAYKTIDGKKWYGKWSKTQKIRTK